LILSVISGAFGWTYYEGQRSAFIEVELKLQEAREAERIRMEAVNKEVLADAHKRIAALEAVREALEQENAKLDELADSDPSTTGLSASRLLRIDQVRSQPE